MSSSIIVAIEDEEVRRFVELTLGHELVRWVDCANEVLLMRLVRRHEHTILLLDHPRSVCPFRLAQRVKNRVPRTIITVITKASSETSAVTALRSGISNYIRFPSEQDALRRYLRGELRKSNVLGVDNDVRNAGLRRLIGKSRFIRQLKLELLRASSSDSNVLITGETGTGKELAAELIHENSRRKQHLFECINCAALPDSLFESELFGHERGAFTGAVARYDGKLCLADNGTIFFDEIGDMSMQAQAKVLRIIEGKPFEKLGGLKRIKPNVRFICATNRDLEAMTARSEFRSDLFFRINVQRVHLVPLRDRPEDIPLLVNEMIAKLNNEYGRRVLMLPKEILEIFLAHDWPGNVRELGNVMEATFANLDSDKIRIADLPSTFRCRFSPVTCVTPTINEQNRLLNTLHSTDWNLSKAARRLSLSRMTLYRKMAKFHISRNVSFTGRQTPLQGRR
jgi:DNA-binding NtrC family response regulator